MGNLGATYDDRLRLIGKRIVDFLLALIELFFARCYGVTECLTSDIFSMLLCGVSDCIIVFSIVLAP